MTVLYRPVVPFMPLSALLSGIAFFVVPAMVGGVAGARMTGAGWRSAL